MSHLRFLTVAVFALTTAAPAVAQFRPYVAISKPRVGFKPGSNVNEVDTGGAVWVAKRNQWAPISFELEVLRKLDPASVLPMKLRVEGRDADETRFTLYFPIGSPLNGFTPPPTDPTGTDTTAPVKWVVKSGDLPLRGCARPGGGSGDLTLTIMSDVPKETSYEVSDPVKIEGSQLRDPSVYVVLGLGSRLPGFDLSDTGNRNANQGWRGNRAGLRGGRVESAVYDTVAEMPDDWFGYEGADLVVLPTATATPEFLESLFDPDKSKPYVRKREALVEWVRRGGKLLVSVGREADRLKQYPAFVELLPAKLTGFTEVKARNLTYSQTNTASMTLTVTDPETKERKTDQPFRVATLDRRTDRPALVLMTDAGNRGSFGTGPLVAAQMSVGLGRISVVGVDVDAAPFTDMTQETRRGLWDWFIKNAGSERAAEVSNADRERPNYSTGLSPVDMEDGAVAAVRRHIDEFEGVPVISFGWVALFILLYTLLIGPVEYLILKKIFGRLELTWVTFPIIVLSVSAGAYFTAYAIKGKDLRINKIDVIDIDVQGQRVYGRTWFTVFSPRVDTYTVGIEPKAPWAAEPVYSGPNPTPPSMVDWLGGIRAGTGGAGGFRTYRYDLDGTGKGTSGLAGVPIQVWSTKSFVANWSGEFDRAKPPVTADLAHPPANPKAASGRITANLPLGNLQEGFAFFAGNAYKLDALPDGQPVRFDSANQRDSEWEKKVTLFDNKFSSDDMYDDFGGRRSSRTAGVSAAGPLSLWGVLLNDRGARAANRPSQNSSVRGLDQSWRLDPRNTEEVMIVAKLARATGPAEQLMTDPSSTSPSKLWLRGLPGQGTREAVPGILQQETYVRIFVPVKAAGAK